MYEYPYGNSQQLNLDWILNKLKEIEGREVDAGDLKTIANALLSLSYNPTSSYQINDIVFDNTSERLYICNTAIPAGGENWTPAHWDEVKLGDAISTIIQSFVSNIKYVDTGTAHYLAMTKGNNDINFARIEDVGTNNSQRIASSKAVYDLNKIIQQIVNSPNSPYYGKTFSIIGDSMSTFEGYIYTSYNNFFYSFA